MYRIKNWNQFQHYKDRTPPWIKLYPRLLDDVSYIQLSDRAKVVLFHCWMAGAKVWNPLKEVEPLLPSDGKTLRILLQLERKLNLIELESAGYLIPVPSDYNNLLENDDSILLDKRYTETEAYKPEVDSKDLKAEDPPPDGDADYDKEHKEKLAIFDDLCRKVQSGHKDFNPWAFTQKKQNRNIYSVECFIDLFTLMLKEKNIKDPWAWAERVFSIEAQNTEARLSEAESREMKDFALPKDVLKGLGL